MSKYTVSVTETETCGHPSGVAPQPTEIFRQGFDELDLSKFVVALNQKPRGRPARSAKKEVAS